MVLGAGRYYYNATLDINAFTTPVRCHYAAPASFAGGFNFIATTTDTAARNTTRTTTKKRPPTRPPTTFQPKRNPNPSFFEHLSAGVLRRNRKN